MEILKNAAFYKEMVSGEASREYEFDGDYGPMIAIHGVFGGWSKGSLKTYMERVNVKGTLLYCGLLLNGIDTYVPALEKSLLKYKNPLIVGLSAGGIVAIRCITKNNYWDRINKIITVGSPLGGIPVKISGFEKLAKTGSDLETGGVLLKKILETKPPENKILSVFARNDFYTPHPKDLNLPWPSIVLRAKSHADLILNQEKWLKSILNAELGID